MIFDFAEQAQKLAEPIRFNHRVRLVFFANAQPGAVESLLTETIVHLGFVKDIGFLFFMGDFKERRLRDIDGVGFDQFAHVTEEESEQQGANVSAVHVGVGHDDDFAVTAFG